MTYDEYQTRKARGEKMNGRQVTLIGQRFGRLVVIGKAGGCAYWWCQCDCGSKALVRSYNLLHGKTQSCGCLRATHCKSLGEKSTIDLTGRRFGRLTVLEQHLYRSSKDSSVFWLCRCDCGVETVVNGRSLRTGNTQSCGCLRDERIHEAWARRRAEKEARA